jgi:hypothetical protein
MVELNKYQEKMIEDIMRSLLGDVFSYLDNDVSIVFDEKGKPEVHINENVRFTKTKGHNRNI